MTLTMEQALTPEGPRLFSSDCDWERDPEPSVITIFGASGDLTGRKLIPALYNLFLSDGLPERSCVLGAARTHWDDEAFRERMRPGVEAAGLDLARWDEFARRLYYQPVDYDEPASYQVLASRLKELARAHDAGGNRVFNLALPPSLYGAVAGRLGQAGLAQEGPGGRPWSRLVVEKPFGYDLASARELDATIAHGFREHQVYRIDHYMTKQTVRNIMVLRFANSVFEPLWNRNYIEYVRINASEALGVEHRAGYYDRAGVLRDMFQNHMMELLALVAAEPPSLLTAEFVRDKKTELLSSLRPFDPERLAQDLVLGQYAAGEVEGKPVPAYREEPGVDPQSLTPTYGLLKVMVDNWRWKGVPFYMSSGKRLARKETRIDVQFKLIPHSMFQNLICRDVGANRLVISIYPQESIFLNFQAMKTSVQFDLRTAALNFLFRDGQEDSHLGAYEVAYSDVLVGDQSLFWRQDALELSWRYMEPILQACAPGSGVTNWLHPYAAGSLGPQAAIDMLPAGCWPEKP